MDETDLPQCAVWCWIKDRGTIRDCRNCIEESPNEYERIIPMSLPEKEKMDCPCKSLLETRYSLQQQISALQYAMETLKQDFQELKQDLHKYSEAVKATAEKVNSLSFLIENATKEFKTTLKDVADAATNTINSITKTVSSHADEKDENSAHNKINKRMKYMFCGIIGIAFLLFATTGKEEIINALIIALKYAL
jgi:seryl-tRNA synthetase